MLVQLILKSKASSGVVTIAPEATISEAAKLLGDHKIGTVVVSSDGETAEGINQSAIYCLKNNGSIKYFE